MFLKDFLMRTIFKVFMTVLLLSFMIWSLGAKACAILVLQPGIEPAAADLEGEILTPGAPGMSLYIPLALSPSLFSPFSLFHLLCGTGERPKSRQQEREGNRIHVYRIPVIHRAALSSVHFTSSHRLSNSNSVKWELFH